ncbi:MAG: ATP-binding protein [Candidatus Kapabacteria bacterium]|nr:ATP-binding protein [Ignavibacteriota bacterium]MCW5885876.1 ATP-binding protein [Candidatus Kapabacteria bacterium]
MNVNTIKRVIADQTEELKFPSTQKFIVRDLLDYAKSLLDEKIIKVVTGVRRCGKSTFCHQLLNGKKYAYLNFDDERLIGLTSEDLDSILENLLIHTTKPEYLFFDEIQNVHGWELFVNRLSRQGYNIILTCSNGKMLSRELATHLTGRHVQVEMFPFSFNEFLRFKNAEQFSGNIFSTTQVSQIKSFLEEYIEFGGFPEVENNANKKRYLRDLYDKVILRDIVERYNIRDIALLKELAILLLNYFSSLFTYNKLSNSLNAGSVNTIKEFTIYLEDTYLLNYVSKFSFKLKEEIRNPRKVYCIDTGMISSLGTSLTPNIGRKIENLVFLHERRKSNKINYFSDGKSEVDFVITDERNRLTLIQVAYNISDSETYRREIDSLVNAAKHLKPQKILLINEDREDIVIIKDIEINIIPLWKYLTV